VEQYCPRSDVWTQVASLPRRRLQFAVAVVGQCVYVVGGRDGLRTLDVVQVFDVNTRSWSSVRALNTQRHGLGQCQQVADCSSFNIATESSRVSGCSLMTK